MEAGPKTPTPEQAQSHRARAVRGGEAVRRGEDGGGARGLYARAGDRPSGTRRDYSQSQITRRDYRPPQI